MAEFCNTSVLYQDTPRELLNKSGYTGRIFPFEKRYRVLFAMQMVSIIQHNGATPADYRYADRVLSSTLAIDHSSADLVAYLISARTNLNEIEAAQRAFDHFRLVAHAAPLAKLPDLRQ